MFGTLKEVEEEETEEEAAEATEEEAAEDAAEAEAEAGAEAGPGTQAPGPPPPALPPALRDVSLYAVFDGHGGPESADFAAESLPRLLLKHLAAPARAGLSLLTWPAVS
jgi:hypothetical protein